MRKAALLILAAGLVLAGCEDKPKFTVEEMAKIPLAKRDGLPEPSGGFTLSVGDQTITSEDVIGPIYEKLAPAAQNSDFEKFRRVAEPAIAQQVVSKIADALLYSKAKKDAGDKIDDELDKAATAEVRRFVMDFGGDYAKAEQALRQMGMDWGKFEEYKKRYILSQSYLSQKMPKDQPITYNEMITTYNATKEQLYSTPGVMQFRLIDLEPAKLQDIDANRPRQEQAMELADGIMKRLKQGEDFEQLAKEYSQANKAVTGGLWPKLAPDSLVEPYDVLAKKAATMKPGELAGPVEVKGHIFIMQLVAYQPKGVESFEKVQNQVKARISFERMRQAIDKLNDELVQQASSADREKFVDFCVREAYRMANK
jgi:peptidyl-prolyl cis-trans isomerase SurA